MKKLENLTRFGQNSFVLEFPQGNESNFRNLFPIPYKKIGLHKDYLVRRHYAEKLVLLVSITCFF